MIEGRGGSENGKGDMAKGQRKSCKEQGDLKRYKGEGEMVKSKRARAKGRGEC